MRRPWKFPSNAPGTRELRDLDDASLFYTREEDLAEAVIQACQGMYGWSLRLYSGAKARLPMGIFNKEVSSLPL